MFVMQRCTSLALGYTYAKPPFRYACPSALCAFSYTHTCACARARARVPCTRTRARVRMRARTHTHTVTPYNVGVAHAPHVPRLTTSGKLALGLWRRLIHVCVRAGLWRICVVCQYGCLIRLRICVDGRQVAQVLVPDVWMCTATVFPMAGIVVPAADVVAQLTA